MIVEYIRYRIAAERQASFEGDYAMAAAALSRSPHCLDYELTRSVDEPACYVLRITWTSAEDHLSGFRTGALFPTFLAAIRGYVGDIEEMRHYEQTAVRGPGAAQPSLHEPSRHEPSPAVPTLYDWAGGTDALTRLTEVFYGLVAADELVGPLFAHMDRDHPRWVAMWLAEVFGGPDEYTRHRGGYAHMLSNHVGKAITEAQRRRWVGLLLDAADEVGLPADPSSAPPSPATSSGAPGSRCRIPNPGPGRSATPRFPDGDGESPRRTGRVDPGTTRARSRACGRPRVASGDRARTLLRPRVRPRRSRR